MKNRKEKKKKGKGRKEKKREKTKLFKYQSQTLVIITQSLECKRNNGELGPHVYSFPACMTSKISQLKFGVYNFERVQWSRIKSFEKN